MEQGIEVEVGSYWIKKSDESLQIVKKVEVKEDSETYISTMDINTELDEIYTRCLRIDKFLHSNSQLFTADNLHSSYLVGRTDGYSEGYQYGFTLAKEKITELDEEDRSKVYGSGWDYGYQLAKRDSKKSEGFEEGYNTAIKEMSNSQALGETTEYKFGTEGFCERHNPNKETQEAMQEVLNKVSKKHSHYFKDTSMFDEIDTYLLARIWNIEDKNGAYFHAFKKVLDAGKRGNKGKFKDIGEAIDSLKRYLEIEKMFEEKDDD